MTTTTSNLGAEGLEALRRGDAATARDRFGRWVALEPAQADAHLGLAYACQAVGDAPAALAAVEQVLRCDPGSLRALALKGDLLVASGQVTDAAASYRAALASVQDRADLPVALQHEFDRAAAMLERVSSALGRQLRSHLGEPASPRMGQALDILTGERRYYPSEPRHFLMPGLPSIQFHDRAAFPWLDAIEAATDDIRREVLAVLADPGGVVPYLQSDPKRSVADGSGLLDNLAWSAFHLWQNGQVVEAHAARCPRTMAALRHAPLTRMAGRSPAALFSILRPGAHIPPHHGFVNTRLIVHLPLIVPPGCSLRVGNETREWVEGRAWLFDDTIEHEAWNRSDRLRAILLFEVWRPELSEAERQQIDRMFSVIDRQRGVPADWGI